MDAMYIAPAIRLQCTVRDYWMPEILLLRNSGLTESELDDALHLLESRGQIELAFDDYADSVAYRHGCAERFIERKHPSLTPKQVLDATEYALRRGLLDADIQAELEGIRDNQ